MGSCMTYSIGKKKSKTELISKTSTPHYCCSSRSINAYLIDRGTCIAQVCNFLSVFLSAKVKEVSCTTVSARLQGVCHSSYQPVITPSLQLLVTRIVLLVRLLPRDLFRSELLIWETLNCSESITIWIAASVVYAIYP